MHGLTANGWWNMNHSKWQAVAEENGFLIAWPDGKKDNDLNAGSWNVSTSDGPLGPPCDLDRSRWIELVCYDSCPLCDSLHSCDFSTCHDDIGFIGLLIRTLSDQYCVDMDHVHMTGLSNGGMFAWHAASVAPQLGLASINPVAASPFLGFGLPPAVGKVSVMDFHGLADAVIPENVDMAFSEGPHGSLVSLWNGFYHSDKKSLMEEWSLNYGCEMNEVPYETNMDGVGGFHCYERKCPEGIGMVRCTGSYGHSWPFNNQRIEGAKIAWEFMKLHPRVL